MKAGKYWYRIIKRVFSYKYTINIERNLHAIGSQINKPKFLHITSTLGKRIFDQTNEYGYDYDIFIFIHLD